MLKPIVTFYNEGQGDDTTENIGWWWAYLDKDGNQEPSFGPFETEQEAKDEAQDDQESGMG